MERWNGWGDEAISMDLPPGALALLKGLVGEAKPPKDCPLERVLAQVPASRLPSHPGIVTQPMDRLIHSHGQSLPDWVHMRAGTIRRFPDGVACPATLDDLTGLLDFAATHGIIVIPYGGGTSVVGHLDVPDDARPVLSISMKRLNRLVTLDSMSLLATFEAGIRGPEVESQLGARGFTLGHYPQSYDYSSLGGWVVTRSSGQQALYYGGIDKMFVGGDLYTPKGIERIPEVPSSAAGPDLRHLVLGSEGRLGILARATVRISPVPAKDVVYGVFFPTWENAFEAARTLAASGLPLSMVRLSNPVETMTNLFIAGHEREIALLKKYLAFRGIPEHSSSMCLLGFIGSARLVRAAKCEAFSIMRKYKGVSLGTMMGKSWKKNRFLTPYLRNTLWDLGYAVDTLETAVPWSRVDSTMQEIERVIGKGLMPWNENVHVFTHLSRLYPMGSSIYTQFLFRLGDTPEETLERWKTLKAAASRVIVDAGGTISHQHGVGIDHKEYLEAEKGKVGMEIIRTLCATVDPDNRMNPTKLV